MSKSNYQFPPSSPLHDDYSHDIKGMGENRGRTEYPTPNPSSSLFRSSSPAADTHLAEDKTKKSVTFDLQKARINTDFNILNPDANVMRIPLLENQSRITIGRSSKSCDFFFASNDKNVSRLHISVSYNVEQLVLTCLGHNGLAIRIPKPCYVFATNSTDNYVVLENVSRVPLDLDSMGLKESFKSIKLDSNHTEFTVRRKETITLPRFANILIEINNHIILLNPLDHEEELTDDELPVLISKPEPLKNTFSTPTKPPVEEFTPKTPLKANLQLIEDEPTPSKTKANLNAVSLIEAQPETTEKSNTLIETPEIKIFKIFEDSAVEERPMIQRSATPLSDKSNTFSAPATPKRKAQSEEPQPIKNKKKKKSVETQKVEVNQEWIANVEQIPEINNILINHLAFSRLSSTPASFLQTISVLTSQLTLREIRVLLHNIQCIGVIYRQGKDAAGKQLEEEYYYMPENDVDDERPKLVASIKGHGGLRSCRRTHKQYYWKKPAPIKK